MYFLKRLSILLAFCSLTLLTISCSDTTTDSDDPNQQKFNSQDAPGESAQAFLEDEQYTDLQVEIDYMPNHEPTQDGLDSLRLFLEQRLNKQNISLDQPTRYQSKANPAIRPMIFELLKKNTEIITLKRAAIHFTFTF